MVHCNLNLSAAAIAFFGVFADALRFLKCSSYIGTIKAVPMVSELASKKCRPFMSFFWGQSTGEFNCMWKDLPLEHSCFVVNGTKGPLAGCLDVQGVHHIGVLRPANATVS